MKKNTSTLIILFFISFFSLNCFSFSDGININSNIAYGEDPLQKMDVYSPNNANNAPVIFMVHGGAWKTGDKSSKAVVENKIERWVPKGFIFISVNYRLMPQAKPLSQSEDIMRALLFAKKKVSSWGGSPSKMILMGHSAGAHLISLLSSSQNIGSKADEKNWLGVISIDSAVYDLETKMTSGKPKRFYKKAFGEKKHYWKRASPYHQLNKKIHPFLAICSKKRKDDACLEAEKFVTKAKAYGSQAQVLAVDFSHRGTNTKLGKANAYTRSVEAFMRSLDSNIAAILTRP